MTDESKGAKAPADADAFRTAAADHPSILERIEHTAEQLMHRGRRGLSHGVGLVEVPGSTVPGPGGTSYAHVMGPQQAACDPVAAGLDTTSVLTRAENRVVTLTGEAAAGPRPATYLDKTGADPDRQVPQAAPPSGANVAAQAETEAAKVPGPNGGAAAAGAAPAAEAPAKA